MVESFQEEGHILIVQEQEKAFAASTLAAAELDVWLQFQRGNIRKKFTDFIRAFSRLYRLTYRTNQMFDAEQADHEYSIRLKEWMDRKDLNPDRVVSGLELFDEYQRKLFSSGLFTVRK